MRDHNVLELEPSTGLLARGYLRLGVYAMQAAGPSARTLAALYELADRRTRGMRVSIARIGALLRASAADGPASSAAARR